MTKKALIGVGVVLAVAGLAVGAIVGLASGPVHEERASDLRSVTLSGVLDASDALVIVDGVKKLDSVVSESGAEYQVFEVSVQDVLYQVKTPNQGIDMEYPAPPAIALGILRVYEPLGSEVSRQGSPPASEMAAADVDSSHMAVLFLGYWAPEVYLDWPATWGVVSIAMLQPDGAIGFVGDREGRLASDLTVAGAGTAATLQGTEQLTAWLVEKDVIRGGGPEGPMQAAFNAAQPDPGRDAWFSMDPSARPLDPELTPPEVLATLVETPIMIFVSNGANAGGRYLAILTDSGVAHVAELSGGSHPATVFTNPGEQWRVVVTDRPDQLGRGRELATVAGLERAAAGGVILELTDRADATAGEAGGTTVSVRVVTAAEFRSLVDAWLAETAVDNGDTGQPLP